MLLLPFIIKHAVLSVTHSQCMLEWFNIFQKPITANNLCWQPLTRYPYIKPTSLHEYYTYCSLNIHFHHNKIHCMCPVRGYIAKCPLHNARNFYFQPAYFIYPINIISYTWLLHFTSESKEESIVLSIQQIQAISPMNLQNQRRKYFKLHIFMQQNYSFWEV
jgi:hypothetical protein